MTVTAVWLVPHRGAAQLQPDMQLVTNLDVDGDGVAEAITATPKRETVWFDRGRKPVDVSPLGSWIPWGHGHVLAILDGDAAQGFVRATAKVVVVTPKGAVSSPDVADALWKNSVAGRCPVKDVIAPNPDGGWGTPADAAAPASSEHPPEPCKPPSVAVTGPVAKRILDSVFARERERGLVIAEGPPELAWSCRRNDLAVVVTYCEGTEAMACDAEHGVWMHEIWTARGGSPSLLERTSTGSVLMEWSHNGAVTIAGHADVDGDGDLDPIIESSDHEGGSGTTSHLYRVLVGGALKKIVTRDTPEDPIVRGVHRAGTSDAIVIEIPEGSNAPAFSGAWVLDGKAMRELRGSERRALRSP
jgi:hypothetical protein